MKQLELEYILYTTIWIWDIELYPLDCDNYIILYGITGGKID
jgi:hypothetical protein